MSRVHEVLRWANRRAVAEEVTKRGYRVSGETLNRWVRDGKEFPAVVESIVFDLFTIGGHNEAAPPDWAERLQKSVDEIAERQEMMDPLLTGIIEALAPEDLRQTAAGVIEQLVAQRQQHAATPPEKNATAGPGAKGRPDR